MRISLLVATLVAGFCVVCSVTELHAQGTRPPVGGAGAPIGGAGATGPAAAAQPSYAPVSHPIVVLDLSNVFKNLTRFTAAMKDLKQEADAFEAQLKQTQEKVKGLQASQATFKAGTQEYKQIDEQIAKIAGDTQASMSLKKKDLMEREAKLYFNTYEEVSQTVARFAEANGIQIVIRYSADKIDKDNANSVLQGVNRPIVYNQPGLDITKQIIDLINRNSPPVTSSPSPNPNGGGSALDIRKPLVPR